MSKRDRITRSGAKIIEHRSERRPGCLGLGQYAKGTTIETRQPRAQGHEGDAELLEFAMGYISDCAGCDATRIAGTDPANPGVLIVWDICTKHASRT